MSTSSKKWFPLAATAMRYFSCLIIHAWLFLLQVSLRKEHGRKHLPTASELALTGAFLHIWAVSHAGNAIDQPTQSAEAHQNRPLRVISPPGLCKPFSYRTRNDLPVRRVYSDSSVCDFVCACHIIISGKKAYSSSLVRSSILLSINKDIPTILPSLKDFCGEASRSPI